MKTTKILKWLAVLAVIFGLCFVFAGCTDGDDGGNNPTTMKLTATKWKLVGFYDVEKDSLKEAEPKDEQCYTLEFDTDTTISGTSSTNKLWGNYKIDDELLTIQIANIGGTEINELYDGQLYMESLWQVQFFTITDKELKLYYDNKNKYLLYNPSVSQADACNFDNSLTDLLWLKTFVNRYVRESEAGFKYPVEIYQCTYDNGKIGFFIDPCVSCPDGLATLYSCDGTELCSMGGITGENTCNELNIDFANKKLIWEINIK